MNGYVKNFLVLGFVLVFIPLFFAVVEINRSQNLINVAGDPQKSINRGFDDAESEFSEGIAYYHRYNGEYLGVRDRDLKRLNQSFRLRKWICVVNAYVKPIGLKIEDYEYNSHYVLAYNIRLKTLADSSVGADFNETVKWLVEVNPAGFFSKDASYNELGEICSDRVCFKLILTSYGKEALIGRYAIAVLTSDNIFLGSYFPLSEKPARILNDSLHFESDSTETKVSFSGALPPSSIEVDGKYVQFYSYP